MQITKREFLKQLGLVGAAGVSGAAFGDEFVATSEKLPAGSCGDPDHVWFGRHIFPLEHTMQDGPSCFLKDGRVFEPAKEINVFHRTDVVVVGGGPAGFAAAIAAARTGAKVALVERYGSLGGLFTNGMVLIMLATCLRNDGKWQLVTRGVCEDFMKRAGAIGKPFSSLPSPTCPDSHWQPTVDPECAKYLMDTMVAEQKNIEMFFHSWGVDVIQDGNALQGVVFESKEGRQAILAKQVVDCTGDADMLFRAGGDYKQITHSVTTVFRWANMDTIKPSKGAPKDFPTRGNEGNPDARWCGASMNTANALSIRDLSRIEVSERRKNWEQVMKLRATPGWEKVYTSNSASQIGIRGSRLVETEFVTGRAEIAAGFDTKDVVGWTGHDSVHEGFPVVYRQILPKKVENLLCAGRCLGKGDTVDAFRLICPCFVTGEAAGTAAALAALRGTTPRALDIGILQKTLRANGQYLG